MRHASFFMPVVALLVHTAAADTLTLKNGSDVNGQVSKYSKGQIEVFVPSGYVAGVPSSSGKEFRMSNVRTIQFDGRDDYYSFVLKNGEVVEGEATSFSKGEFVVTGSKPIKFAAIKEFSQTEKGAGNGGSAELSLLDLSINQTGQFKHALLVGFVFEKGFVGQLNYRSASTGKYVEKVVIIRGVDTSGITSGSWVKLNQDFKVSKTERLTNGDTVLVAEPVDPSKTNVSPAEPMINADRDWRRVQPENP